MRWGIACLVLVAWMSASEARAQQATAAPRVPLTTQTIQRFVSWLESHSDVTQVSLWTDDGTTTGLVADGNGSLLCAGARNSPAACVRDSRPFARLWRTGIREDAQGHINAVSVAAGPLPDRQDRALVVEFALPAATVSRRNSVQLVAGSAPTTPFWMGEPFNDAHPADSLSALARGTPDLVAGAAPPWMADSSRLEIVPVPGATPAVRVIERFSAHQAVCLKLEAGWRCVRRERTLADTNFEELTMRVLDLRAAAPNPAAPWWGVEYEWRDTTTTDGANGTGGAFVEVLEFNSLPHIVGRIDTGSITWANAIVTVGGRRLFQRNATRAYHPVQAVGQGCLEMPAATPVEGPLDSDFRTPAQARPAGRRATPAAAPDAAAATPAPATRLRYDGTSFTPGTC